MRKNNKYDFGSVKRKEIRKHHRVKCFCPQQLNIGRHKILVMTRTEFFVIIMWYIAKGR